jgi:hypothetical protein
MKTIKYFQRREVQIFENDTINQNCIHEGITSILNSGNICFYFAHCYLKTYRLQYIKTKILSVVYMGAKLGALTLKDGHGLGAFVSTVLRKIRRPTRQEVI